MVLDYYTIKFPGNPHVRLIYVPSQYLAVHLSGLQPLHKDKELIEKALWSALVGEFVTNYGYDRVPIPCFAYVDKRGVFVNVTDAMKPISQDVDLTLCPKLYGYRYYYRLYYEKVRMDDHDDFEERVEEEYAPFYVNEDNGSSNENYMVLVKIAKKLRVAVLYKIQQLQLQNSMLRVKGTAIGYVPFKIIHANEVCSEDSQIKRSCYLDQYLDGTGLGLWSIFYEIEEKEVALDEKIRPRRRTC